jgi:hypothetical protein
VASSGTQAVTQSTPRNGPPADRAEQETASEEATAVEASLTVAAAPLDQEPRHG